jgi:type VI secretion system protein ImpL
LVNSGLDFPLAERFGKAAIGGVGGTRNCDWWFTSDAILLDTAGRYVTQDSDRAVDRAAWKGFLGLLKKHRRRRPINGVLVAISLSDLMLQSEQERDAHARAIKERVQELQRFFGIRFPVYVIFTKADLVAGFMEFFDDLGREERAQVWGTTFPIETEDPVTRFADEYDALLTRLNERLLWRMDQERDLLRRSLIYGFPQQMASLKEVAVGFLRDVFSATRFDERPLLRGAYLTSGTQEGTPIDRMIGAVARRFGIEHHSIATAGAEGRSYFITDMLERVVFNESELAGTNRRLERHLRFVRIGAYVLALVLTVGAVFGWSISYTRNQQYIERMDGRIAEYEQQAQAALAQGAGFAELLPALNALAQTTDVYAEFDDGVPLLMGLGMYQGRKLGQAAREAYARTLRRTLAPMIASTLARQLAGGRGDVDFQYTGLKLYLGLQQIEHFDPELLRLWMEAVWQREFAADPRAQDRLQAHLEALIAAGPEPVALDENLIEAVRAQLTQVPLAELVYGRLKRDSLALQQKPFVPAQAMGAHAAKVFERASGRSLEEPIPELFTVGGYLAQYQKNARLLIRTIRDETWVLGVQGDEIGSRELDRLDQDLGRMYAEEYVRYWRELLLDLRIVRFRSVRHGLEVLEALSGRRSPLRGLLQGVKRNTELSLVPGEMGKALAQAADSGGILGATKKRLLQVLGAGDAADRQGKPGPSAVIERSFEDLNRVVSAKDGGAPPIDGLLQQLSKVYAHLDATAEGEEGNKSVLRRLRKEAIAYPDPLKGWLRQVAASTESVTQRKRAADVTQERGEKRTEVLEGINEGWNSDVAPFCRKAIAGRYPVSRGSDQEITLRDFGLMFGFGGHLAKFFDTRLKPYVDMSGPRWRWRDSGGISLGLPDSVLEQFQISARIRDTLFQEGGTSLAVKFVLKPISLDPEVVQFQLDLEGQTFVYAHGPSRQSPATWPNLAGTRQVRMFFEDADGKRAVKSWQGPWAWFRLLDASAVERRSAERLVVTFESEGYQMSYEIIASSVINPFLMPELDRFRCLERF